MRFLKVAILTLALSLSVVATASAEGADTAPTDLAANLPEPGTLVLLLTGIGIGAGAFIRRRK